MLIDLKNTTISFEDGYTATGAVNNVAGIAQGATTMAVDGFTVAPPVGARLSIAGDTQYKITAATTTSISFTPPLVTAATDNDVVVAGPRFLDIKVGEGQITWSEKKPREYKMDRGRLDQVRNGDEVPMDVSIQLMYEELLSYSTNPPTPEDVLKQRSNASSWVSADLTDPCAPYAITVSLMHVPPGCTSIRKEKVELKKFRYEELNHDPKQGQISCTGKCNVTEATVTRLT